MTKTTSSTTPTQEDILQQEIIFLAEAVPDIAEILLPAIDEGRINGVSYSRNQHRFPGCGCAYGQLARFDNVQAIYLSRIIHYRMNQHYGNDIDPVIEGLLIPVKQGQTSKTSKALETLRTALVQYQASHQA